MATNSSVQEVSLVKMSTLPEPVVRRGITDAQWRTLCKSLFPGAKPESVLLVWDYCLARKLDPLKKPCHIVPMEIKVGNTYEWRDVVMPGIYEHRTTAQRTGEYLGHAKPEFGPIETFAGVDAPAWCEFTVYRWNQLASVRAEFPVRTWFREVVATKRNGEANARWAKAPVQMLTKCAEAAALREAFPDELGGQQTEEEMDGQRAIDAPVVEDKPGLVKPEGFDQWADELALMSGQGSVKFGEAWAAAPEACRVYLTTTNHEMWEALKKNADEIDDARKEAQKDTQA
jgi:phage recombination protein Bet